MKTYTFEVMGHIDLTCDINSKEFKEALEGYKHSIDRDGDGGDMLKHVAFYITRFGVDGMVEGVGYVGYNGTTPTEEPYSGIMVESGYDEFDFEEV